MKKSMILSIAILGISQLAFAFDCDSVKVNPLPADQSAKSVYCVASGLSGKQQEGPAVRLQSLTWPIGSQAKACQEILSAMSDPNAVIAFCAESTQDSVQAPQVQSPPVATPNACQNAGTAVSACGPNGYVSTQYGCLPMWPGNPNYGNFNGQQIPVVCGAAVPNYYGYPYPPSNVPGFGYMNGQNPSGVWSN